MDLMTRRNMLMRGGNSIDWESIARGMVDNTTEFNITADLLAGETQLAPYLFHNKRGLKSIEIPDTVTVLGVNSLYSCTGLTSLTIPDSVTIVNSSALNNCTGITELTFPNNCETLGNQCCRGMSALTRVEVGTGCTKIDAMAFYWDNNLSTFIIHATTPPQLANTNAFASVQCNFYVPDASVNDYKAANNWSTYARRIFPISDLNT